MLELIDVCKRYGNVAAVEHVTATFPAGVIGLVGHNGAGKTTLMQLIATLTRPTSGQIRFDGEDIVRKPDAIRRRLGYLPQAFGVYDNLTAREFLDYFAALKGVRDAQRVSRLLELVNLQDDAHRIAATFSGGMRQRLGIAQALLNDPDILIVDEPTAGLDPGERVRFRNLLNEIGFHKLVLVSTHIVSDIENMASWLAVMEKGRLIAMQRPEDFLNAARGRIWGGCVDAGALESLRHSVRVLHAQRVPAGYELRVLHDQSPARELTAVEPTLEDALMLHAHAGAPGLQVAGSMQAVPA